MRKTTFCSIFAFFCLYLSFSQRYSVIDFGAKPDGKTLNTPAIQRAIDSCTQTGGTVYVPSGTFITGTLELKSNVNLYLERGAVLLGSPHVEDYRPYQAPDYERAAHYGIIYAHGAKNVSITGQGAINGNEEAFFDFAKAKGIEWGGVENTRQKKAFRSVSSGIGDGPVLPKERPRQMLIFSECKNVLLENVQLLKSPFWTLHLADCDGVVATGLKIWASLETPNSDGMDITSSSNIEVSDCDIRTGDDAIAITGYSKHYELPGFLRKPNPSENITITNCNLQSRSSGIRIGYIDQNSVKNIHISNVNITNSNRGIGIFVRGEGDLSNITISQVNIETRLHTGDWWGNGEPIHISAVTGEQGGKLGKIKNVTFRDITCTGENGILIYGSPESVIEDVQFHNLQFHFTKSKLNAVAGGNIDLRGALKKPLFSAPISAIYGQYIKDFKFENVKVTWGNVQADYFKYGMHFDHFDGLRLMDITAEPSPSNPNLPAVFLENGSSFKTDLPSSEYKIKNVD